jgi:NAD(P)-dependent dehydrogenase (short-subunit alcohol dehydrogenase family)
MDIQGKVFIVTGGASGLGEGTARMLAAQGGTVVIADMQAEKGEAVAKEIGGAFVKCDVSNEADGQAVVAKAVSLGILVGLVNCAGIILRDGKEFTIAGFQQVIDVNLTGTMRMCMAAHPLLKQTGGAIVNTASVWSFFGGALVPAYTASKGGVAQLTKALAVAWAPTIRVNAIAPGWVETALTAGARSDAARSQAIIDRTPQGRWGKPQDIGGAVVFLCSEGAGFITGTVLPVDGGYTAK